MIFWKTSITRWARLDKKSGGPKGRRVEDSLFPPGLAEKAQHRGRCIVGEGQSLCRRLVHDLQPGEFRGLEGVVRITDGRLRSRGIFEADAKIFNGGTHGVLAESTEPTTLSRDLLDGQVDDFLCGARATTVDAGAATGLEVVQVTRYTVAQELGPDRLDANGGLASIIN